LSDQESRKLTPVQERAVDVIAFLAVNLVDHPEDVRVELVSEGDRELVRVQLHPDDRGEFIGKGGQTARAMRTLLAAIGGRSDERLSLEIVD